MNRAQLIEDVRDHYLGRITALLESTRDEFKAAGYAVGGPFDHSDDEYRWVLFVGKDSPETESALTFEIAEAASYGDEPGDGITFHMNFVQQGGLILGQLAPWNYTPRVWIRASDAEAVEERFREVETADHSAWLALFEED